MNSNSLPEIIYFTETPYNELVCGKTSNYYDLHLKNLAGILGKLRVLHFSPVSAVRVSPHPRIPGVEHVIGGEPVSTPSAIVAWSLKPGHYLKGPTLLYIPYVSTPCLVGAAWKRLWNCKIYLRYTWSPRLVSPHSKKSWKRNLLSSCCENVGIRTADWIGAGSSALLQRARKEAGSRDHFAVTTNIIDVEHLPLKENYSLSAKPTVAVVGRLNHGKRIEWAIEAARILGLRLHVFGEGELRPALERMAAGLDVSFHGNIPNQELVKRLVTMDMFVIPSAVEGVPKALLEAMGAGLPCIGCDVPGVAEWLRDGCGVVAADSLESFVAEMRSLLENQERRQSCGRNASRYSRGRHNAQTALAADRALIARALMELGGANCGTT